MTNMEHKKEYTCVCGKVFTNPQSFNGHKTNCKKHHMQKYGNLNNFKQSIIKANKQSAIMRKVNVDAKENEKLISWITEEHKCEKCGKVMTEFYGSGRFCSSKCARSYSTLNNREEVNKKISNNAKNIIYCSNGKQVIRINSNDEVPRGFIKGNFNIAKCSFDEFKDKKLNRKSKQDKLHCNKKHNILTENEAYITLHNQKILYQYEKFLEHKAKNKEFVINKKLLCMYGKYQAIIDDKHPRANARRVFVHVLLAEALLDRPLNCEEVVHHKNEDKLDNRFDNIYIFKTKADHARFHLAKYYWLKIDKDVLICEKIDIAKLKCNNR